MKVQISCSGTQFPAVVGILYALDDANVDIKLLSTTSIASIVCAAYCSGYNALSHKTLLDYTLDFVPFAPMMTPRWFPFVQPYGLYHLDKVASKIESTLPENIGHLHTTFSPLTLAPDKLQLHICDSISVGNEPLSKVVQSCCSMPLVFQGVQLGNSIHHDASTAPFATNDDVLTIYCNPTGKIVTGNSILEHIVRVLSAGVTGPARRDIEIATDVGVVDYTMTKQQAKSLAERAYTQTAQQLRSLSRRGKL